MHPDYSPGLSMWLEVWTKWRCIFGMSANGCHWAKDLAMAPLRNWSWFCWASWLLALLSIQSKKQSLNYQGALWLLVCLALATGAAFV